MKSTLLILLFFVVTQPLFAQKITYSTTAERNYIDIQINGKSLSYTSIDPKKMKNDPQSMVAQVPQWDKNSLVTQKATLTSEEITALSNVIKKSDFLNLPKEVYGGAVGGQRYYTYALSVKQNKLYKLVTYQSFPNNEPCPEAFSMLEKHLLELIKQKFK